MPARSLVFHPAALEAFCAAIAAAQPKPERYCNKCGYFGPDEMHNRPRDGKQCDYLSCPVKKADERGSAEHACTACNAAPGEVCLGIAHSRTAPARAGSEPGLREDSDHAEGVLQAQYCNEYAAQRAEPQGLTEDEIRAAVGADTAYWATSKTWIVSIARAIEAALAARASAGRADK